MAAGKKTKGAGRVRLQRPDLRSIQYQFERIQSPARAIGGLRCALSRHAAQECRVRCQSVGAHGMRRLVMDRSRAGSAIWAWPRMVGPQCQKQALGSGQDGIDRGRVVEVMAPRPSHFVYQVAPDTQATVREQPVEITYMRCFGEPAHWPAKPWQAAPGLDLRGCSLVGVNIAVVQSVAVCVAAFQQGFRRRLVYRGNPV